MPISRRRGAIGASELAAVVIAPRVRVEADPDTHGLSVGRGIHEDRSRWAGDAEGEDRSLAAGIGKLGVLRLRSEKTRWVVPFSLVYSRMLSHII